MKALLFIVFLGYFGHATAGQVTNVTATAISNDSVMISWSADADAAFYEIYQDSIRSVTNITDTTHTVSMLAADTHYQFFITSCDAAGVCSEASAQAGVLTLASLPLPGAVCELSNGVAVIVASYENNGDGTADVMWCSVAGSEGYNLFLNNDYIATYGPEVQRVTVEWVDGYEYQVAWFANGEFPAKSAVATDVDKDHSPTPDNVELLIRLEAQSSSQPDTVEIYFTRHAEKMTELAMQEDGSFIEVCGEGKCSEILNAKGELRAELLAELFRMSGISSKLTHTFSSHKHRTRQTIAQIALDAGLTGDIDKNPDDGIQELPILNPDGTANATELDPESTSPSEQPTIDALLNLPGGSAALVAGHSGTIYDIMVGIGLTDVCLSDTVDTCNQNRYPINSRFKVRDFGDLWKVILRSGQAEFVYRSNLQPRTLDFVDVAQ